MEKGFLEKNKRIRMILKFDNVLEVKSKNINKKKKYFLILAIETKFMPDKTMK